MSPHRGAAIAAGASACGLVLACCLIAGSNLQSPAELAAAAPAHPRLHRSVLRIARELHSEAVPRTMALKAAKAFSTIQSLCGAANGSPKQQAAMARFRARADKNWWAALKAFATEDEVHSLNTSEHHANGVQTRARTHTHAHTHTHTHTQVKTSVMQDPHHVHLLVFVAPSWCSWSQKQLKELQENFDDLGEATSRVHLIDVDDPANKALVQFEGVSSFPTIVVVQGNNILGKASGFKDMDTIHDIAFVDTEGVPFDTSFPSA